MSDRKAWSEEVNFIYILGRFCHISLGLVIWNQEMDCGCSIDVGCVWFAWALWKVMSRKIS